MVKCTCYYRDYWKYWLTGADKAHAPSPSDSGNSQFHHPLTSRPYFRQLLAIKKKKKRMLEISQVTSRWIFSLAYSLPILWTSYALQNLSLKCWGRYQRPLIPTSGWLSLDWAEEAVPQASALWYSMTHTQCFLRPSHVPWTREIRVRERGLLQTPGLAP